MILIADSGSTKTDWAFVFSDRCQVKSTQGINPFFVEEQGVYALLKEELGVVNNVVELHFYGAGCSSPIQIGWLTEVLKRYFVCDKVFVYSDLLGAARSLCQQEEGIACILGTGSNSCYYNGKEIEENVPSLGYIFGDEGGGAALGRQFIQAYLRGELPVYIKEKLEDRYTLSVTDIIYAVYKKPFPNRFLASFAPFLAEHQQEEYISLLIRKNIDDFFTYQLRHYAKSTCLPIHCVGSMGVVFEAIVREVAAKHQLVMGQIIKSPLEGLVAYHQR